MQDCQSELPRQVSEPGLAAAGLRWEGNGQAVYPDAVVASQAFATMFSTVLIT